MKRVFETAECEAVLVPPRRFSSVQLQNLCFKQSYNKKFSYRRETARQLPAVFLDWLIDRA